MYAMYVVLHQQKDGDFEDKNQNHHISGPSGSVHTQLYKISFLYTHYCAVLCMTLVAVQLEFHWG